MSINTIHIADLRCGLIDFNETDQVAGHVFLILKTTQYDREGLVKLLVDELVAFDRSRREWECHDEFAEHLIRKYRHLHIGSANSLPDNELTVYMDLDDSNRLVWYVEVSQIEPEGIFVHDKQDPLNWVGVIANDMKLCDYKLRREAIVSDPNAPVAREC